jgi:hypothetical protein
MYSILSVNGPEAAERLLNETMRADTELIDTHIDTVRQEPTGEHENVLLGQPVTRFTFIFRYPA